MEKVFKNLYKLEIKMHKKNSHQGGGIVFRPRNIIFISAFKSNQSLQTNVLFFLDQELTRNCQQQSLENSVGNLFLE